LSKSHPFDSSSHTAARHSFRAINNSDSSQLLGATSLHYKRTSSSLFSSVCSRPSHHLKFVLQLASIHAAHCFHFMQPSPTPLTPVGHHSIIHPQPILSLTRCILFVVIASPHLSILRSNNTDLCTLPYIRGASGYNNSDTVTRNLKLFCNMSSLRPSLIHSRSSTKLGFNSPWFRVSFVDSDMRHHGKS